MGTYSSRCRPGQFESPEDLEYGGKALEPQTKEFISQMQKIMPPFKDVVVFDVHTGLGDQGRLHLLTDGDNKSLHPELFSQIFKPETDQPCFKA